jgi:predicted DNA-binding transcriptional regulator YafY
MAYARINDILSLALAMQGSASGLSIEDIKKLVGVGRRTAERLRDAAMRTFPQIEEADTGERIKRWRLPRGTLDRMVSFTPEEFTELQLASMELRRAGLDSRADIVMSLGLKLRALSKRQTLDRIEPDLEALLEAEGFAARPGPHPIIAADVLATLRDALKASQSVRILFRKAAADKATWRIVDPLGILYGNRHYLVAVAAGRTEPYLWSLSKIEGVKFADRAVQSRPEFSIANYAARAFGVFQERAQNVVWRFSAIAAPDARTYHFHSTETREDQPDGTLIVRFQAGGLQEMCWHLFIWGREVEVLEPQELRLRYAEMLEIVKQAQQLPIEAPD